MILTGETRNNRITTCPFLTLTTKHLTWTNLRSNPDLHGDRTATNRLSYGMARNTSDQSQRT